MSEQEKVILDTDDEAAKFTTNLSGWVSRHGRFYGDDEARARIDGATHKKCNKCESIMRKSSSHALNELCEACHSKEMNEREKRRYDAYEIVPFSDWPIYSDSYQEYFTDEDDFITFIDNLIADQVVELSEMIDVYNHYEIDKVKALFSDPHALMLLACEPQHIWEIDPTEIYADILYGDDFEGDLPTEIEKAFDILNEKIRRYRNYPISYICDNKAIDLKSLWDHISHLFSDEESEK